MNNLIKNTQALSFFALSFTFPQQQLLKKQRKKKRAALLF
jgi:hypothetical protein